MNFKSSLFKLMIAAGLSTMALLVSAQQVDANDIDTGDTDITGLFDLTITGDISTVVACIATPPVAFTATINNIAAPYPSDTGEVTHIITETLSNVSGFSNLKVVFTSNTSSRVTFTVSFDATQNGDSVQMELEYDYVK